MDFEASLNRLESRLPHLAEKVGREGISNADAKELCGLVHETALMLRALRDDNDQLRRLLKLPLK